MQLDQKINRKPNNPERHTFSYDNYYPWGNTKKYHSHFIHIFSVALGNGAHYQNEALLFKRKFKYPQTIPHALDGKKNIRPPGRTTIYTKGGHEKGLK